ncbi:hypothetical protein B0H10DRAFT_2042896 [Mycena sp. CBHHK59/15]|nr:hypothetical protein B0H10DRAFT_2042896 [Mycena sp. CBHHK59/15]
MPHILSSKSKELGRDIFLFTSLNPSPARLVLGVNQKLTPVSSATIQRWIRIISPETTSDLFICPVNVQSVGIFEYCIQPNGPSFDGTSDSPLPPGDYGLYYDRECTKGGFRDIMALPLKWNATLEYQANHKLDNAERIAQYQFSPDLEQSVIARDNHRCRFTGVTTDTALSWIFPPVFKVQTKLCLFDSLDKDFVSPPNVLTMHANLKIHFHNNHFGVDVDDGYKIIILRDIGSTMSFLPAHLPRHPAHDATVDAFLRDHFRFSIATMLLGSDIRATYGPPQINKAMGELGFDDDGDEYILPLSDERWQTELGQEILENLIRRRATLDSPTGFSDSSGSNTPEVSE